MGKRIVITSFGSFGDVFPYIGLALGLRARGHHPVLAMPPFYRSVVEREGLEFRPVRPDVDPTDRETVRRIMNPRTGTEFLIREVILGSLGDSYTDLREAAVDADVLVTHPVTFAGPILAQSVGLPWISTVLAPISFFSSKGLPVFPPVPWTKRLERIPGLPALLVGAARLMTRGWAKPVYRLRRELGLPTGDNPVFNGQHSPHAVLALFSRLLADPQPDWPPNVHITGAIPYNGPVDDAQFSPKLERFLEAGGPPIVFTLGSSAVGAAGEFFRESLAAVRGLGARAVLLVGSNPENRPEGAIPDSILLEEYAPHAALFPRASLVVHQGGAGTLHQAMRSGRPALIVPFANDQPDNAHRVSKLGVSRTLTPREYTVRRVMAELRMLLSDTGFRDRAGVTAKAIREEDAIGSACDVIERLMVPTRAAGLSY